MLTLAGCGQPKPEPISPAATPTNSFVVAVGARELTARKLDTMVAREIMQRGMSTANAAQAELVERRVRRDLVRSFISQNLLYDEAERLGIKVEAADVDRAVRLLAERLPAGMTYEEHLKRNGLSDEGLRSQLARNPQLRITKLLEQEAKIDSTVSDEAIAAVYRENPERFVQPAIATVRHFMLKCSRDDEQAQAVRARMDGYRAQLAGGIEFGRLAKAHSEGPAAQFSGDLGEIKQGDMAAVFGAAFEEAVFTQPIAVIGEVFRSDLGFHVVQVLGRTAPRTNAFETVRASLRAQMQQQRYQRGYEKYLAALAARAGVRYGDGFDQAFGGE